MSMSTHVTGFVPPDETWLKMKAIWDACAEAGIAPPEEVEEFFDGEAPDPAGQEVDIPSSEWRDDSSEGIEITLADVPSRVKIIRFYNSW
jgi:hypothetical protein